MIVGLLTILLNRELEQKWLQLKDNILNRQYAYAAGVALAGIFTNGGSETALRAALQIWQTHLRFWDFKVSDLDPQLSVDDKCLILATAMFIREKSGFRRERYIQEMMRHHPAPSTHSSSNVSGSATQFSANNAKPVSATHPSTSFAKTRSKRMRRLT